MTKGSEYYGKYLKAGTFVRYDGLYHGDDPQFEYGVVVHCWMSPEIDAYDCYVAFYGFSMPPDKKQLDEPPYILRYSSLSLVVIDKNGNIID